MNNQNQSPFDGKMILVIGLTFAIWVGYQSYLRNKYPEYGQPETTATETAAGTTVTNENGQPSATGAATTSNTETNNSTAATEVARNATPVIDQTLVFEDDNWKVIVNSKGMGITEIDLKNYSDRDGEPIKFIPSAQALNLETNIIGSGSPIYFSLERTADQQITGRATVDGMQIIKIYNFESSRYVINYDVRVDSPRDSFSGITTKLTDKIVQQASSSFFNPQQQHQEFYINYDGTDDRQLLEPTLSEQQSFLKVNIAALASQYFAFAVVDQSKIIPDFRTEAQSLSEESGQAMGTLTHQKVPGQPFQVRLEAYAGPKSHGTLEAVNPELTALINFGFFKTLAEWIFKLLQSIQVVVGNWGVAIILLTILVRAVLLPFNIMSYRSMKAMAKIQPEMKAIREKYKDDSQMANQEIMRVMKEAKANPVGGCLPMLLQIPVFFALYQVLGQSIELYQAPFALWITDLSLKDPFFVLPVFMGATMFVQQKITPTTMEPAQQKILMFMPIFLTFLLASLPSGLTLYMFVSTLFGVLQQLYFMRDEKRRAVATA